MISNKLAIGLGLAACINCVCAESLTDAEAEWANQSLNLYKHRLQADEQARLLLGSQTPAIVRPIYGIGQNLCSTAIENQTRSIQPKYEAWAHGLLFGLNETVNRMVFLTEPEVVAFRDRIAAAKT